MTTRTTLSLVLALCLAASSAGPDARVAVDVTADFVDVGGDFDRHPRVSARSARGKTQREDERLRRRRRHRDAVRG
jgi:hypothetical protein